MDATEVAQAVASALEVAQIPYAIGGAIAYGFFGPPRGTFDVDVNVFVSASEAERVLDALCGLGISFDRNACVKSAAERGDANVYFGPMRIDLFFNSIPVQTSAQARTVRVTLHGHEVRVLSPEDTAVFKLLFFRGKDIVDLERPLASTGPTLDRAYVRRWLIDTVGDDDHRVKKWDELCAAL
jgi:hypothetical protein